MKKVDVVKKSKVYKILKNLSIETWERIEFTRTRKGLKIYETTITQNLLYLLKKYSEYSGNKHIEMFEATNEKTNGNDIEICINTKDGYLLFPTQAKILYKSGKYDKINHGNQIENIVKYAKRTGGIPLHLFYNYDKRHADSEYGCTIIKTKKLLLKFGSPVSKYKVRTLKYAELHMLPLPKAKPWHKFFCSEIAEEDKNIKYYSR